MNIMATITGSATEIIRNDNCSACTSVSSPWTFLGKALHKKKTPHKTTEKYCAYQSITFVSIVFDGACLPAHIDIEASGWRAHTCERAVAIGRARPAHTTVNMGIRLEALSYNNQINWRGIIDEVWSFFSFLFLDWKSGAKIALAIGVHFNWFLSWIDARAALTGTHGPIFGCWERNRLELFVWKNKKCSTSGKIKSKKQIQKRAAS